MILAKKTLGELARAVTIRQEAEKVLDDSPPDAGPGDPSPSEVYYVHATEEVADVAGRLVRELGLLDALPPPETDPGHDLMLAGRFALVVLRDVQAGAWPSSGGDLAVQTAGEKLERALRAAALYGFPKGFEG